MELFGRLLDIPGAFLLPLVVAAWTGWISRREEGFLGSIFMGLEIAADLVLDKALWILFIDCFCLVVFYWIYKTGDDDSKRKRRRAEKAKHPRWRKFTAVKIREDLPAQT